MIDKDLLRSDRAALEQALTDAGAKIRGRTVLCPFHDDKHPSGSIYEHEGIWRFKCMACEAGGDIFDIRALIAGTTAGQELNKIKAKTQKRILTKQSSISFASLDAARKYIMDNVGSIEEEYNYTGADGDIVQIVFRCRTKEGKTFRPVHLSDNGYCLGGAAKPWPLYRLSKITESETVIVVEGEKCVKALTKYSFRATTSAGGAKNAKSTDWQPLAGKKIILWPDNDADGRRYAADVESILQELNPAPRILIIEPVALDLAEHEDAADFISQLEVIEKSESEVTSAINTILKDARLLSIAGDVRQRISDIRTGRYSAIRWPWDMLNVLTKAFLPMTVTLLAGSVGATKSFAVLQLFVFLMLQGIKVALYEAEEDRTFHLMRVLAQEAQAAWLTDPEEVKLRADEADRIAQQHADILDRFGRVIYASPETQPTLDQLALWVNGKAKAGCRIIGIDPITVAARTDDVWKADGKFLQSIKRTATNYGCSILLVTHPVKNLTYPDVTQLAGAACYQRFSQTILWLESHDDKTSKVRTACGTTEFEHNRTFYILKARNGKGGGYKMAFNFNVESLTLNELGLIMGKKKNG